MSHEDPWMSTLSCIRAPFHAFSKEHISLVDIAGSLAKKCRFAGHIEDMYSVGQHCVWVSDAVRRRGGSLVEQQMSLIHDASEAYLGDMVAPWKSQMPEFRSIEDRIQNVIYRFYGLPTKETYLVRHMDRLAAFVEAREFHNDDISQWGGHDEMLLELQSEPPVYAWTWRVARERFLEVADELGL